MKKQTKKEEDVGYKKPEPNMRDWLKESPGQDDGDGRAEAEHEEWKTASKGSRSRSDFIKKMKMLECLFDVQGRDLENWKEFGIGLLLSKWKTPNEKVKSY